MVEAEGMLNGSSQAFALKSKGMSHIIKLNLILFQKPQLSQGSNITVKLRGGAGAIK